MRLHTAHVTTPTKAVVAKNVHLGKENEQKSAQIAC